MEFITIVLLGTSSLLLYYFAVYYLFRGQNHDYQMAPPFGISPATMRYISNESQDIRYDARCLVAIIISGATKECLEIRQKKDSYSLIANSDGNRRVLSSDERCFVNDIFADDNNIDILEDQELIVKTNDALAKKLRAIAIRMLLFSYKKILGLCGIVASVAFVGVAIYFTFSPKEIFEEVGFILVMAIGAVLIGILTFIAIVCLYISYHMWRQSKTKERWWTLVPAVIGLAFLVVPIQAATYTGNDFFGNLQVFQCVVWILILVAIHMGFALFMAQRVLERVKDFREYLQAKPQPNQQQNLELFDRYFAYAVALEVEDEWVSHFRQQLLQRKKCSYFCSPKLDFVILVDELVALL